MFVAASHYITDKKLGRFVVSIFALSLIHKSALILLPLYFLLYKDFYLKYRTVNILVLIVCTVIGTYASFSEAMLSTSNIFSLLGYDAYAENMDMVLEDTRTMTWGPVRIILYLKDILIIWCYPYVYNYFNKDRWINMVFNMFLLGTCLYNLLVLNGIMFTRPLMYLRIFGLIMAGLTLYVLFKRKMTMKFSILMFSVISYIYISHFKLYAAGVLDSPILYKFCF